MEVFLHFPFTAMILKPFTKASRLHGRQNKAVCQLCQYEELYDNSLMATPAPALAWPAIVVLYLLKEALQTFWSSQPSFKKANLMKTTKPF